MPNQQKPSHPFLKKRSMARFREAMRPYLLPAVSLVPRPCSMAKMPMGASRLGGCPDVWAGFAWPEAAGKPLDFLAQIDLAAMPRCHGLPESGSLLFFYDVVDQPWGYDPKDRRRSRVLFSPDRPKRRLRRKGPVRPCVFKPSLTWQLPFCVREAAELEPSDQEWDAFDDLIDNTGTHLLGHPDIVQNPMEDQCKFVSHGLYVGNDKYRSGPRFKKIDKLIEPWRLLLQIDSCEDADALWGDSGVLYFWIRDDDLQALRFDRTVAILQCA